MKENDRPFFSVVLLFYNDPNFILDALMSVENQTYRDFELILINNGSFDQTSDIVSSFCVEEHDYSVVLYQFEKNQGIAGGRNKGVELATGKYICFLDADDLMYPQKLETIKNVVVKNNPDLVYHWFDEGTPEKSILKRTRSINNEKALEDFIYKGCPIGLSTVAVNATKMKQIGGFDRNCRYAEDFDCWLKFAQCNASFYCINKSLGMIRKHGNNTSIKQIEFVDEAAKMVLRHIEELDQDEVSRQKIKRYMKWNEYIRNYNHAIVELDKKKKRTYLVKCVQICPFTPKAYVRLIQSLL